jgi:hypothetical protein
LKGHSGVRDAIERVRQAFPDWTETVEDIIIDGDKAVTRYVSTGVHKGPFFDLAPTGEHVCVTEISIIRVHDGLFAEQVSVTDRNKWWGISLRLFVAALGYHPFDLDLHLYHDDLRLGSKERIRPSSTMGSRRI